ncbi:MAG TPA: patatin-like phospholipase family protein [Steroidobacteraceae bacterium]|jgi:hypothetical protein|nr:patatin-like phospholipase family protein [Steroidobacteraceae bacterium]
MDATRNVADDLVIGREHQPDEGRELEEERLAFRGNTGEQAPLTALCLSGGGIRSATFSLGVLQGLARLGWLDKFTYLSTVSGGGYIGSWLSSWIRRKGLAEVNAGLAGGSASGEPREIRQLRSGSNFLSPTTGLSGDTLALVATFVRNLLINWTMLLPLLLAATLVPMINVAIVDSVIRSEAHWAVWQDYFFFGAAGASLLALTYMTSDLPSGTSHQTLDSNFFLYAFLPVLLGGYLLSLALANDQFIQFATDLTNGILAADQRHYIYGATGAAVHLVAIWLGREIVRPRRRCHVALDSREQADDLGNWIPLPKAFKTRLVVSLLAIASGAIAGYAVYGGVVFARHMQKTMAPETWSALYATFAVPFLLLCFALGTVFYVALIRRNTDEGAREWWARSGGVWISAAALWVMAHALCIWAPAFLSRWGTLATGGVGTLGGVLVAIAGYKSNQTATDKQSSISGAIETLNVRVLDLIAIGFIVALFAITSLLIVGWSADLTDRDHPENVFRIYLESVGDRPWERVGIALGACALAWVFSWFAGVNAFSMHAMYGNRLARAFLGATREPAPGRGKLAENQQRRPHAYTGFDPDDDVAVADMGLAQPGKLFHVINIALNFMRVSGNRLEWQERKAASFTVTPFRTGSRITGFCKSDSIGGGGATEVDCTQPQTHAGGITIGRAMTISGAAVAPSMGFHSSKLIAIVMTFFNVRLGWWLPNPMRFYGWGQAQYQQKALVKKLRRTEPAYPLFSLLREMFGRTREDTKSVYLSDGGHFENLGLYEMVRRRCSQIVVVDAGCDPEHKFDDLERAMRIIRNDLGTEIEFPYGLPTVEAIARTKRHYTIGHIRYPGSAAEDPPALLLYIKPGLNGDEPLDVARYAARARDNGEPFPHQSTSDQFFDEPQFESYRALGRHSMQPLIREKHVSLQSVDALLSKEAEEAKKAGVTLAAVSSAAITKEKGGVLKALGELFSWDKLPGLLATALGVGAGAAQLAAPPATNPPTQPQARDGKDGRDGRDGLVGNAGRDGRDGRDGATGATGAPGIDGKPAADRISLFYVIYSHSVFEPWSQATILPLHLFSEGGACPSGSRGCPGNTVTMDDDHDLLDALDQKIAECGRDATQPLTFTVRGYASTSEFTRRSAHSKGGFVKVRDPESDLLNLQLADRRAANVANRLPLAMRLNSLPANEAVLRWVQDDRVRDPGALAARMEQMRDAMYIDRPYKRIEGAVSFGAGGGIAALNRRVDIEFTSLGGCSMDALQRAIRMRVPTLVAAK